MENHEIEAEIRALSAETLAIQMVLLHLFAGLKGAGISEDILKQVFDRAANSAEDIAIAFGDKASPEHTVKAVRIVEQLRAQVFPA